MAARGRQPARGAGSAPRPVPGAPGDRVELGRIERARGLDGRLTVAMHGADPSNLLVADEVTLRGEPGCIPFRILEACDRGMRADGRARVELQLAGLDTREAVRDWIGAAVSIPASALRRLPEGEYYWRDLIGLEVRTLRGERLGSVREIWPTPAHDLLVIEIESGADPLLVPAVEPVLVRVDLTARELWIDPPEGLMVQGSPNRTPE